VRYRKNCNSFGISSETVNLPPYFAFFAQVMPLNAEILLRQVAFMLKEAEMKYLLLGFVMLGLTTFMFVLMAKAALVELRQTMGRGKSSRRN
jgi:hypothetical protein